MDYKLTEAINIAKQELMQQRELSADMVDAVFKKIIYNFLKI